MNVNIFQTPNMNSVGQMLQSMSVGSPYSCVSSGGGSAGPQGVDVGIAVVAPQPREVANVAPLQPVRFGVAAGSIGMCESRLLYTKSEWLSQNFVVVFVSCTRDLKFQ
jgi:hypothetical protein